MAESHPLWLVGCFFSPPAGTSVCHFSELNCSWKRETKVRAGTNSVSGAQESKFKWRLTASCGAGAAGHHSGKEEFRAKYKLVDNSTKYKGTAGLTTRLLTLPMKQNSTFHAW